jgi:hypothetical protein
VKRKRISLDAELRDVGFGILLGGGLDSEASGVFADASVVVGSKQLSQLSGL